MVSKLCFNSLTEICPGAELLPPLPNVIDEPKVSPLNRLIEPRPPMDMVTRGRSA